MSDRVRLFAASFLMLFVELVLIRWLTAHILYLSYFTNFVLLGSFLGIGIGFLRARRGDWFSHAPLLFFALVVLAARLPVTIDRSGSGLVFFGNEVTRGLPIWLVLPFVFVATAATLAAVAQLVGRLFSRFSPLQAYRLDILGSIAGIATFSVLSLVGAPPVAWGVVIVGAFVLLLWREMTLFQVATFAGILATFGSYLFVPSVTWSPYYRIEVDRHGPTSDVFVNGIPHQSFTTLTLTREESPAYFIPYQRAAANPLRNVLVIGAGTGTDVAIALSEGAQHVDAVEIDPELYRLGRELNPEHPFADPRVSVSIDDGRAFLDRTDRSYDLILFALPDSLTLVAGQSSLRLESYLFTREAMEAAMEHLTAEGVFSMYNYYRYAWLADRLANTLKQVYGHPPCLDTNRQPGYLAVLTTGYESSAVQCPTLWAPVTHPVAAPATDDRPFVYLHDRSVPTFYLISLALILLLSTICVRVISGPLRGSRPYLDFFFMGAAFLLLETKSVVQFALLFGTTWFVNALVFAGILLTVLLAIEVSARLPRIRPIALYGALALSLTVAYLVPPEWFLHFASLPRFGVATALAFAPVFFANLVFAERFRDVEDASVAFGTNLLGAMFGGTLEYAALMIGYRALLIVALALYALAASVGSWSLRGSTGPNPASITHG
ncbi:MAG: spermidine synthase [Actinomycetota bacterium]|nr:spermidine synthase [Actinomycetota bacterium]